MPPPKGSPSNNPAGRPPKSRALTAILERALAETRALPGSERKTAGKQLLARYVTDAVLTGQLPYKLRVPVGEDGLTVEIEGWLSAREWLDLVKWVYGHIDGAPKAEVDVTSGGQALKIIVEYADPAPPDDSTDPAAPPSGAAGDCAGE